MIAGLPSYISIIFGLTTLAVLLIFIRIVKGSSLEVVRRKTTLISFGLIIWLALQAVLAISEVYKRDVNSLPPKIILFGILPAIIVIALLFLTAKGRQFIDSLPLTRLTYLHIIRIPVEIVLLWLFLNKAAPQLMTFEGRNFDIISGITAPFIAYFGLTKCVLSRGIILLWNFVCLGLLLNIVINALLSAPSPIQKFAFDQPNIAILNFPFVWLPTFIVPLVLLTHLISIRRLLKNKFVTEGY
jgi:hypothetical protein